VLTDGKRDAYCENDCAKHRRVGKCLTDSFEIISFNLISLAYLKILYSVLIKMIRVSGVK